MASLNVLQAFTDAIFCLRVCTIRIYRSEDRKWTHCSHVEEFEVVSEGQHMPAKRSFGWLGLSLQSGPSLSWTARPYTTGVAAFMRSRRLLNEAPWKFPPLGPKAKAEGSSADSRAPPPEEGFRNSESISVSQLGHLLPLSPYVGIISVSIWCSY